jgi:Flp pilus assembly pilin Flp
MMNFSNLRPQFKQPERGQGLVEYALLIVLVAIVVVAALSMMGGQVRQTFNNITCVLDMSSTIRGVNATWTDATTIVAEVYVRKPTNITISGDASGGGACESSCNFILTGLSKEGGKFTVEADGPGCTYTYTW